MDPSGSGAGDRAGINIDPFAGEGVAPLQPEGSQEPADGQLCIRMSYRVAGTTGSAVGIWNNTNRLRSIFRRMAHV
jgi:hypothetical protein